MRKSALYIAAASMAAALIAGNGLIGDVDAADSPLMTACRAFGEHFAEVSASPQPDARCFGEAEASALPSAIAASADSKVKAVGAQNLLFVEREMPAVPPSEHPVRVRRLISGSNSGLKEITALGLNEDATEVYALDAQASSIFMFPATMHGSIFPFRTLASPRLAGATSIAISSAAKQIAAAYANAQSLMFFRLEANQGSPAPEASTEPLREIRGPKTELTNPAGVALNADGSWVLETSTQQILFFSSDASGDVLPKRRIRGPNTQLNFPTAIRFSADQKRLQVVNGDGKKLSFHLDDEGDVAPQP